MIVTQNWLPFFPYKTPRPEQIEIINTILNGYLNPNIKYAIIDAPTGIGKSAIAYTVAKFMQANGQLFGNGIENNTFANKTYYLTSQKLLQDQYLTDFPDLVSIKSKSNYPCYMKDVAANCEDGTILKEVMTSFITKDEVACKDNCCYSIELASFIRSKHSITNYQYFLNATKSDKLVPRSNLLILDECHLIENELWRYIEVEISERFIKNDLEIRFELNDLKIMDWINAEVIPAVSKLSNHLNNLADRFKENGETDAYLEIKRRIKVVENYANQLNSVCYYYKLDPNNYVFDIVDFTDRRNQDTFKKILIKPVNVAPYTDDVLFSYGKRVMLMSATIGDIDYYMKNMGISKNNSVTVQVDSPFPIENRPIYIIPVGSMGSKNIQTALPKLTEMISGLLDDHKNQKGVIFCNSYKIANHIRYTVKNKRLIFHTAENRIEQLNKFMESTSDTVFVAVAMSTGLDLKGDLSRFQIICKVPYPFLGDKQVIAKKNVDPQWYGYVTVLEIIQTCGRSVRSDTDYAATYILDSDFWYLYSKNKHLFPKYIKDAIHKIE